MRTLRLAVLAVAINLVGLVWLAPVEAEESEEWSGLVAWYFPEDEFRNALDIIECESGGDPGAYNPSGATGLFQIKPKYWGFLLEPGESLYDPEVNVRVASVIVEAGGWRHWTCKRVLAPPNTGSPDSGRVSVGAVSTQWVTWR